MRFVILICCASVLFAQDLRITASTLSANTTRSMFGRLPKEYSAAAVGVCNGTTAAQTVPLVYATQQVRLTNGIVVLPRDAAIAVISAAQGGSKAATALRWSVAAIELAAIATTWAGISPTVKATLNSVALAGGAALPVVATAVPTHTYLTFDHEMLPDPLNLGAAGSPTACQAGVVLIERAGGVNADFTMPLPKAK